VTTAGGVITFTIQAPTQSGPASITATSVEGAAYGDLTYTFTPGPPAPSVTWSIRALEGDGPVEVTMISGIVHDRFGNPVQDGTLLTVDVQGAAIASGDADLTRPGTQVIVSSGRAVFVVEADAMSSVFGITTHDTATVPQLLGQGTYSPANYQAVPLQVSGAIAALILLVAIRRRHGGRSPS
jgi:hypothetical protein